MPREVKPCGFVPPKIKIRRKTDGLKFLVDVVQLVGKLFYLQFFMLKQ